MEHRFDLFTKAMAQEMPRRGALKRIGAGLAAAFVAASGAAETVLAKPGGGNSDCAHWCHENFQGSDAGHCTSDAAHGEGACYQCGPAAPAGSTAILCNGVCVPSDVKNCGTCGNVCTAPANATATCTGGKCGFACNSGFILCGGVCVANTTTSNCGTCGNACTAPANAMAICTGGKCDFTCNTGYTRCGNACVNEQTDASNCGACGHVCPSGVCAAGVCQPSHVGGHCTTNTDCTNASLCVGGICQPEPPGKPCQTGQDCDTGICTGGVCLASPLGGICLSNGDCTSGACSANHVCVCPSGQTQCGNACVPTSSFQSDPNNCGACGNVCPPEANGTAVCTNGTCGVGTCNAGFANCDGNPANGCETNLLNDPKNCGACGNVCSAANGTAVCQAGTCVVGTCNAGFANCDGNPANGCETNTATDVSNCGACGNKCPAAPPNGTAVCANGQCTIVCNAGFTRCGNTCVNTQTDAANCGTCGHACTGGQVCKAGMCTTPFPPQVCTTGIDPQFNTKYIVCRADATTAWISSDQPGGGMYHTDEICQSLGYHTMGQMGGNCGSICGYCQGSTTSCTNPGNETYDGHGACGTDGFGRIECNTVMWQCV